MFLYSKHCNYYINDWLFFVLINLIFAFFLDYLKTTLLLSILCATLWLVFICVILDCPPLWMTFCVFILMTFIVLLCEWHECSFVKELRVILPVRSIYFFTAHWSQYKHTLPPAFQPRVREKHPTFAIHNIVVAHHPAPTRFPASQTMQPTRSITEL